MKKILLMFAFVFIFIAVGGKGYACTPPTANDLCLIAVVGTPVSVSFNNASDGLDCTVTWDLSGFSYAPFYSLREPGPTDTIQPVASCNLYWEQRLGYWQIGFFSLIHPGTGRLFGPINVPPGF